jgi:hypothetical protein
MYTGMSAWKILAHDSKLDQKDNMTDKEKIKKIIRILNKHVEDVGDLAWQIRKITEIVTSKKRYMK